MSEEDAQPGNEQETPMTSEDKPGNTEVGSPAPTTGTATDKPAPTSATEQPQETPNATEEKPATTEEPAANAATAETKPAAATEQPQESSTTTEEKPANTEAGFPAEPSATGAATAETTPAAATEQPQENPAANEEKPATTEAGLPAEPSATGAATAETTPAAAPEQPQETPAAAEAKPATIEAGLPAEPSATGAATAETTSAAATEQPQETPTAAEEKPATTEAGSPAEPSATGAATAETTPAAATEQPQETPTAAEEKPATTEAGSPAEPSATGAATAETTPAAATEQPQETGADEKPAKKEDSQEQSKEFTWTSLNVASDDVLESLETAVQYTSMAQNLRAKGLIPRAIRMMERALMITERAELEHPALALEACKVRLNFAAYLSEGSRNREAVKIIKEAQENLMRLVQWAFQCPPEDLAVQALGKEARTLHISAVVAEAAALDLFEDDGQPPLEDMSEDLKETARAMSSTMAPDHPLPVLVRKAFGVSAATRSQRRRSMLGDVKKKTVSNMPLTPPAAPAGEDPLPAVALPDPDPIKPETPPQGKNKKRLDDSLSRSKRSAEDRDVFKQYLRDREMARVAHLLSLSDDWELQTRRKLEEVHRQSKFELELMNVDELKEKRYSRLGHKVYMHQMRNMNKSWSDPNISREAKKDKTSPEIFHLKKLSRKIYVKPPAQPAPAPPPPKPKVDQSLAGSMKALRTEEHQ